MNNSNTLILGGTGLVGSAIVRNLQAKGYKKILSPRHKELDLTNQESVLKYFETHKPEQVILAAAKVGGILANNTYRADFIHQNLMMQNHTFEAAFKTKVGKLLFLGSSCIYPKECPQPIKEEYLLTGPLEQTNEPYALAKIAGLKTVESYRRQYGCNWFSLMPTNLYGPNDNFDPESSHVIPGMMRRMCEARDAGAQTFKVWGTGKPRREFLFVDDLAEACVFLLEKFGGKNEPDWMNVGTGSDVTIAELSQLVAKVVGFKGQIEFDTSKPDGTMRKLLDVSKIHAQGWQHKVELEEGLRKTYEFFKITNHA